MWGKPKIALLMWLLVLMLLLMLMLVSVSVFVLVWMPHRCLNERRKS